MALVAESSWPLLTTDRIGWTLFAILSEYANQLETLSYFVVLDYPFNYVLFQQFLCAIDLLFCFEIDYTYMAPVVNRLRNRCRADAVQFIILSLTPRTRECITE